MVGKEQEKLLVIVKENIRPEHFTVSLCRRLFSLFMENPDADLLSLASNLENPEEQLLFSEIVQKKINPERAEEGVVETATKMLQHHWMEEREKIKIQIQSGQCSDEEVLALAKKFDALKSAPPAIKLLDREVN